MGLRGLIRGGLLAWGCVWAAAGIGRSVSAEDRIDFNRQIRPILSNTCWKCHGQDDKQRQAGLRLDQFDAAIKPAESGMAAIVPGNSGKSEIIRRLTTTDPDEHMPPAMTGKTVSVEQIDLIKKWIDQGAEYKQHWSFVAPARPALPAVKQAAWVRNPIDAFLLARLEKEGLAPSGEADKITLIRRVTLDLTGLPPTPAEVDAFVADARPEAYEQLIDRLLKSPRYGENMARYWLDAARYGDTHGLHLDNERSMWPYRDWVIRAFNDNVPYDRFTVDQLAGDLLPTPTTEQRVATGFNRCLVTTSEGGSIDEEVRVRNAIDRVATTSTVWMGLTMGCAQCHGHKFDPISHEEFYKFFAFFNPVAEGALDGNALLPPPVMKLPQAEQTAKLEALNGQIADAKKKIAEELAKITYAEPTAPPAEKSEPKEVVWLDDELPAGASPQGNSPWEFVSAPAPIHSGSKSHTRTAAGLSQHFFTAANPTLKVGEGDKLFTYVYLDPKSPPKEIMLQWNDGAWEHRAYWGENVIDWGAANTASRFHMGPLPKAGEWVRLEVEAAKVGLAAGAELNGWAFTQFDGTVHWDKSGIVTKNATADRSKESLLAWAASAKANSKLALPGNVRAAVNVEPDKRNDAQKKEIQDYYLTFVYGASRPTFDPLTKQLADLEKAQKDLDGAIPSTLVMADKNEARTAFILKRGAYDKRGDKVEAGVPACLPPMPKESQPTRLGLAQWLVAPEHPLTARVAVNRYWQQLFGTGLVKTAEDFGAQGEYPSHPELLDWLAVEFRESGWDIRKLMKLMLMSAAYRQSSVVTAIHKDKDPENRLLARGPRFRLEAEAIRDSVLFTSGLLVERIGGKGVKPYQPEGIWEAVGFLGSNTRDFKRDNGDALYRRSIYTFWKRTAPPPGLATFDAPSRESCTVRRPRTNTPLQALALMNDEQYVEAARVLAAKMMAEGGAKPEERIAFAFRRATGRTPIAKESAILLGVFERCKAEFEATAGAAEKLLAIGTMPKPAEMNVNELAAWTIVANTVLNLDEMISKE